MHRTTTSRSLLLAGASLLAASALGCDDGAGWAPLATDQRFVKDMTADGEFVYWTTGDGALRRVSIDGGPVETIVDDITNPGHVAVDGTHVYWSTAFGEIARAPKGGGAVEQLAIDEKDTVGLRIDDTHVYWALHSGRVMGKPKAGEPAVLLADDPTRPFSFAHAGSTLFWSAGGVDNGALRAVAVDGGAVGELDHPLNPGAVAANGTLVCWASLDRDAFAADPQTNEQTITRSFVDGSDTRVLARGLHGVMTLVADEAHVYFATVDGALSAVSVDGGDVMTFASGKGGKTSIAIDPTAVYWAHEAGSAIFVYPKL